MGCQSVVHVENHNMLIAIGCVPVEDIRIIRIHNETVCLQLYKNLYGLLRSALLFYKNIKSELEAYDFVMNPYDPCVFNRDTANGNQHTVIFHVDNGLTSHKNPIENTCRFEVICAKS